jgi:predicted TIM-barrel fold metal-dependent hydrolase
MHTTEAILEPELPIIDPHHHLWDRVPVYSVNPPQPGMHAFEGVMRANARYFFEEFLADVRSGHRVRASVFLECTSMYRAEGPIPLRPVGETEFVNGVAAMSASGIYGELRACAGIVGKVDMTLGDAAGGVLDAHLAAGGGRFRGIRHSGAYDADPAVLGPLARAPSGLYATAEFHAAFKHLRSRGLSFDAWLIEPQLPDLISLARAFPETTIILDHMGTPLGIGAYQGRRVERFGSWRDNIRELARCPNVNVKLGGLAMPFCNFPSFMSTPPASSAQLADEWRPYIETCIEAFGAERAMFESNFPVDRGTCSYATLWNAFKRIAANYSPTQKRSLFHDTAKRVYGLDIPR